MIKFEVTKDGEVVSPELYTWNEETKTFYSEEPGLFINFDVAGGINITVGDDCIVKAGRRCNIYAGTRCVLRTFGDCDFDTLDNCMFKSGPDCTFDTLDPCIFETGENCTFIN